MWRHHLSNLGLKVIGKVLESYELLFTTMSMSAILYVIRHLWSIMSWCTTYQVNVCKLHTSMMIMETDVNNKKQHSIHWYITTLYKYVHLKLTEAVLSFPSFTAMVNSCMLVGDRVVCPSSLLTSFLTIVSKLSGWLDINSLTNKNNTMIEVHH